MNPIGVYIAGASAELERCERAVAAARERGLHVTHDWTVSVRANLAAGVRDVDLPSDTVARHAYEDLTGVRDARVVVLLVPAPHVASTGCWVELGYALAIGRRVVLSADLVTRRCIFESLASVRAATDADAVALAAMFCGVLSGRVEERP